MGLIFSLENYKHRPWGKFIFVVTGIIFLMLFSCRKENVDITANQWKVVSILIPGETQLIMLENSYILEFKSDGTYNLRLDVNSCIGNYRLENNEGIAIEHMACTYICCDSDLAGELARLLPQMSEYTGSNHNLVLEGKGRVVLERY